MHRVQPSSKVNYVLEKNKNTNLNEAGKERKSFDGDSNKKHVTCYNCGKKGHIKKDCRFRKKQKKEGMPNVQVAETNVEEIIAMVSNLHIGMVTELNMTTSIKSFDWCYDSRATVHKDGAKPEWNLKGPGLLKPGRIRSTNTACNLKGRKPRTTLAAKKAGLV
ncbi:hypothetical protein Salat_2117200 [Sesamum alatum]|uniref:CCHC-type domain-containing protein n=1 Tax=Sesamum alatum TaxID=300844 RepID=A0AAE1Y1R5_9LAMI|nr:hypothetical protein Salat_2117200 [Sesamum alatum]